MSKQAPNKCLVARTHTHTHDMGGSKLLYLVANVEAAIASVTTGQDDGEGKGADDENKRHANAGKDTGAARWPALPLGL